MLDTLTTLLPFLVASALVPIQLAITLILLRTSVSSAALWVTGMTAARVAQAVLISLAVGGGAIEIGSFHGPSQFVSYLYLGVAVLFYATAAQQVFRPSRMKAEVPAWLVRAQSPSPMMAFGWGFAYLTLSVKSAVLNMTGVAVIAQSSSIEFQLLAIAVFIALAESGHLALIATAVLDPGRATRRLDAITGWLERHSRAIVIAMGAVFGTWFFYASIEGLGRL